VKAPISTSIAIVIGLIVLLGYFIPVDGLLRLREVLVGWGVILAAVALLVGVANLVYSHLRKIGSGRISQVNQVYSIVLLVSLALTLAIAGWYGPTHSYSMWIFNNIQLPIEASLMAILAVILVYAGIRLLQRKLNVRSVVFVVSALVVLVSTAPIFGLEVPGLTDFRIWVTQVPAAAGARGILLGVGLGITATALRILIGADRPFGG
jgi:hypothetical protein